MIERPLPRGYRLTSQLLTTLSKINVCSTWDNSPLWNILDQGRRNYRRITYRKKINYRIKHYNLATPSEIKSNNMENLDQKISLIYYKSSRTQNLNINNKLGKWNIIILKRSHQHQFQYLPSGKKYTNTKIQLKHNNPLKSIDDTLYLSDTSSQKYEDTTIGSIPTQLFTKHSRFKLIPQLFWYSINDSLIKVFSNFIHTKQQWIQILLKHCSIYLTETSFLQ